MRRICLAILLLALLPATASAAPPAVTTGAAESVDPTAVTLTGTVDPNGEPTTYYFQYATDASFSVKTPVAPAFVGPDPVTVRVRVTGLAPATAYNYQLVASNASGSQTGATRTVTTDPLPRPSLSTLRTTAITATTAVANVTINPRGLATTYHVEYGTSTSYGSRTPEQPLGTGITGVSVAVPLSGLLPYRRQYWRVVATSPAGTTRSGAVPFTTQRAPTAAQLTLDRPRVIWGQAVLVTARVLGEGLAGIGVTLQESSFPFLSWTEVARASADSTGRVNFGERTLGVATRFRAVTRTTPALTSSELGIGVRARVGLSVSRTTRRSVRVSGSVYPALAAGRASLQRRIGFGRWKPVERAALLPRDASRSAYRFTAPRLRRAVRYRVAVVPNDGGAHLTGYSRSVTVARARR